MGEGQSPAGDGRGRAPTPTGRPLRIRLAGRSGQSLVELALLLPILALLAFGAVDLSRGYALKTTVANAAEAGARAVAAQSGSASSRAATAAKNQDPGAYTTYGCSTSVSPASPSSGQGSVSVTVRCTYTPITPFLRAIVGTPTVAVTAVARTNY